MLYLHNIINGVWFIDQKFAMNYYPIILDWMTHPQNEFARPRNASNEDELTEDNAIRFATKQNQLYGISDYGEYSAPEDAPENSIAVITINGAITKHDQSCGPSGMITKGNLLQRCFNNSNIKGIVLNIDSGGGEGYAMLGFNSVMQKKNKPVVAFANDLVASAAYGIASGCDKIIANSELCEIGSVGTYMTIVDMKDYYERQGIKIMDVYATDSSEKNKEFKEAISGNPEPLRKICDQFNEAFINSVKVNRGTALSEDNKEWSKGKIYFAKEALQVGLIDAIDSFDNVLNYFNT